MKWNRGHVIGRGSSATVSVATSPMTGEVIAAVKSAEVTQSDLLQKEAKILATLKSPHIVSYIGHETTDQEFNLFVEYVPGGTLAEAAASEKGLDEPTIRRYTKKIVRGLEYLHSLGIAHCDVKGANILLAGDGPKIADFGCAKTVADSQTKTTAGTPMFMSPEAACCEGQGTPSDIWSLGCTVIEMAGFSPWRSSSGDPVGVIYRIAFSEDLPEIPATFSEEARDFLGKCLRRNPAERWTASELLSHPFLAAAAECPTTSSPTSVFDHGVWSYAGDEAFSSFSCDRDLAIERIQRLASEVTWTDLDGQDWITIRSSSDDYDDRCI